MCIAEARKALGLTQAELGARVGVSQSVVSEWEKESYLPKARDLPLLARALECGIDALFASKDADEQPESA